MKPGENALALVEELELQIRAMLIEGIVVDEPEDVTNGDEGLDLVLEVSSIIAKLGRVRGILETAVITLPS